MVEALALLVVAAPFLAVVGLAEICLFFDL